MMTVVGRHSSASVEYCLNSCNERSDFRIPGKREKGKGKREKGKGKRSSPRLQVQAGFVKPALQAPQAASASAQMDRPRLSPPAEDRTRPFLQSNVR